MIHFVVPGEPKGKARARTFIDAKKNKMRTITPEDTANYENLVKVLAQQRTNIFFEKEPLEMKILAYYSIPKSAGKKQKIQMLAREILPTKKPDIDNVCKIIADSLNGVCYKDDTQIVKLSAEKFYSEIPRVSVFIKPINEVPNENF